MSFSLYLNNSYRVEHIPILGAVDGKSEFFAVLALTLVFVILTYINSNIGINKKTFSWSLRSKDVLDKIPGPPTLPFIGNLHQLLTSKDIITSLLTFSKKFQPYYKIKLGPETLVMLSSPESVEKLLSSNENGHLEKSVHYDIVAEYTGFGLISASGEKWRRRRKFLSPLFNYKCFSHFLEVFNRQAKILTYNIEEMFQEDETPKSVQNLLLESALRIICETSMGVELDGNSKEFDKFLYDAELCKVYLWTKITRPWLQVNWFFNLLPFSRVYNQNVKDIKDWMFKVIREARKNFRTEPEQMKKQKTVMDVMLAYGMSNEDIREESHTMISAGHETTGAALQFAIMLLALHPDHQARCQEEIDKLYNDESKCPDGNLTMSALADMKYTEKCIKETLRLYPIANITGRKIGIPLKLDENVTLPAGTTVTVACTDIHRNPLYYPDPEKFDPSRFSTENCLARHPYAYIPFSAGPRTCVGYKFAIAEMKVVLASILHQFSVSTTDRLEDVPMEPSVVLTPLRGYNFVFKRRNTSAN